MADILFDLQGAPTTPAVGGSVLFPHTSSKQWASKDSNGKVLTLPGMRNENTADIVANAADTYLTDSSFSIPSHLLQARTTFKWRMFVSKTAAGLVAPTWNIRIGTLGTTGDTSRMLFTGVAQTANVDNAIVEITAVLRNIGAAGVIAAGLVLQKTAVTAIGFTNTVGGLVIQTTSAGFDTTTASLIVGVSVNPGAAGVWTHQVITSEMWGL